MASAPNNDVKTDSLLEITVNSFSRMLDNMIGVFNGEPQRGGGRSVDTRALAALEDYVAARQLDWSPTTELPAGLLYAAAGVQRPIRLKYWDLIQAKNFKALKPVFDP